MKEGDRRFHCLLERSRYRCLRLTDRNVDKEYHAKRQVSVIYQVYQNRWNILTDKANHYGFF